MDKSVWSMLGMVYFIDLFDCDEVFTVEDAAMLSRDVKERLARRAGLSIAEFETQLSEAIKEATEFMLDMFGEVEYL